MRKIPNELKNFTESNVLQISGEPTELFKLFSIVSKGEEKRTKSVGRIKTSEKIVKDTVMEYDYKRLFDAGLMFDLLKCRT